MRFFGDILRMIGDFLRNFEKFFHFEKIKNFHPLEINK